MTDLDSNCNEGISTQAGQVHRQEGHRNHRLDLRVSWAWTKEELYLCGCIYFLHGYRIGPVTTEDGMSLWVSLLNVNFLFSVGVQLVNSIATVSAEQRRDSAYMCGCPSSHPGVRVSPSRVPVLYGGSRQSPWRVLPDARRLSRRDAFPALPRGTSAASMSQPIMWHHTLYICPSLTFLPFSSCAEDGEILGGGDSTTFTLIPVSSTAPGKETFSRSTSEQTNG